MKVDIEEMYKDTCEFCNAKKEILTVVNELILYKWCGCSKSQAVIKAHDKEIKEKRMKSLYYIVLDQVKLISKTYKGQPVASDIWTFAVEMQLLEFLEWDNDLLNDMRMLYAEKYKDNVDNLTVEKYYNRYTQLYFEVFM